MRIWTLHPKYLDRQGLLALWREGLLAQAVLRGETKGYRRHPQLERFLRQSDPVAVIGAYLMAVHDESVRRGYNFDSSKINKKKRKSHMVETKGQLLYEWRHLKKKLKMRGSFIGSEAAKTKEPMPHPLFKIIDGDICDWERL